MKKFTLFITLILLNLSSFAEEKILFIGNSYTAGLKKEVSKMFKKESPDSELKFVSPGGCTLEKHLKNKKLMKI